MKSYSYLTKTRGAATALLVLMGIVPAIQATPVLVLTGNNVRIQPSPAQASRFRGTAFHTIPTTGGSETDSFFIRNEGDTNLVLAAPPLLGGADASSFQIVMQPTLTIPPGQRTVFAVKFDPAVVGNKSADISLTSNDPAASVFQFEIFGFSTDLPIDNPEQVIVPGGQLKVKCKDGLCVASGVVNIAEIVRNDESATRLFITVSEKDYADFESPAPLIIDLANQFGPVPGKQPKFRKVKFTVPVPDARCRIFVAYFINGIGNEDRTREDNICILDHFPAVD